jgi:TRAP-type mannitol/chloroaromatic compound transport system permease small subunit
MNAASSRLSEKIDPEAPAWLTGLVLTIDRFTVGLANVFGWMVVPLVLTMVYEVAARYLFHAPTIWAYDVSYMLYGSHFMLGAAFALYRGAHIRTDMFYQAWSERTKGIVDATLYLLFFFPGMFFYFWMSWQEFVHAWEIGERSEASPWRPIIWPFKGVIPLAALLLTIQGVSEFLKSGWAAITGRRLT